MISISASGTVRQASNRIDNKPSQAIAPLSVPAEGTNGDRTAVWGAPEYVREMLDEEWEKKNPYQGVLFRGMCFYVEDTNGSREFNKLCNLIAVSDG